ncbi:uncharacterized protein LOC143845598 [Tasmannia lanceolata]|uniref:uncharacterized protein LOC143845598 n=1 Tax=Tasmannia lanceolata TaxID=3420 RepID=UPI00406371E6
MNKPIKILAAVLPAVMLTGLLVVLIRRFCFSKARREFRSTVEIRKEALQSGLSKLHLGYDDQARNYRAGFHNNQHRPNDFSDKTRPNYYVIRRGVLTKPLFNWADHPSLVLEAVENGWSRFAFEAFSTSLPRSTVLWDLCPAIDCGKEEEVELSWGVFFESADYMQKIRFNLDSKKISGSLNFCSVMMALPLPGPPLGDSSFPQEAYIEITILFGQDEDAGGANRSSLNEFELTKLIADTAMEAQSDSLIHVNSVNNNISRIEERKDVSVMSLGLSGGSPPPRLPGTYPGSIGFNSNGSVHLDGMELVKEAKEADWRKKNKVIGCGFDPHRKKVFFTVDSKLVHEIHCKSEEFSCPLYPIVASNIDVTVVVNMGQIPFKYNAANSQRTSNPCFLRPLPNRSPESALGYEEDSRELFSMRRIGSRWRSTNSNSTTNTNNTPNTNNGNHDDIAESEADLFEIVLDDLGSSR